MYLSHFKQVSNHFPTDSKRKIINEMSQIRDIAQEISRVSELYSNNPVDLIGSKLY